MGEWSSGLGGFDEVAHEADGFVVGDAAAAAAAADEEAVVREDLAELVDLRLQGGGGLGLRLDVGDAGDDLHRVGNFGEEPAFLPLPA